ncbi:hypothetical protein K6V98_04050 [Collinsella sp. AGMB00827]|uniref:Uncharacterized protein n=1 Tax=Collinsella ureilytica TaxID=2869515 RepID=A0ABS7MKB6_9ACTN|nr:hypothetical protein [Collinsella urealyticum]MBY4797530.1 hypothetical protein [Collinsella urealyticum]
MNEPIEEIFDNAEDLNAYQEFCETQEFGSEPFDLDRPALICRWRMAHKRVPLLNRHIRALAQRQVNGEKITRNLVSWAKQHIEWSLAEGDYSERDGVLMLVVDVNGNAAMSVGPYEPLAQTSLLDLVLCARQAEAERAEAGVAPEVLCMVAGSNLVIFQAKHAVVSGMLSLVEQLAATRGLTVHHRVLPADQLDGLLADVKAVPASRAMQDGSPSETLELDTPAEAALLSHELLAVLLAQLPADDSVADSGTTAPDRSQASAWFLVSDEHGIVPAVNAHEPFITLCSEGLAALQARAR